MPPKLFWIKCFLLWMRACSYDGEFTMIYSWSNARCDYTNASISPMERMVLTEGQSKHFQWNQSRIENEAVTLMCIQSVCLWEQPTFYTFIQPSNRDGFGDRAAHAPIDTVLFYTLKRYVCIIHIEGYWDWGVGVSVWMYRQSKQYANQSQSSLVSTKSTCVLVRWRQANRTLKSICAELRWSHVVKTATRISSVLLNFTYT